MDHRGKLIVHVGLHKTATTYLQYHFFPRLSGIRYIHGADFFNQWQRQSGDGNERLLLSYEGFSGVAWNKAWVTGARNEFHWSDSFAHNIESLKRFFPQASLIIFFRRHGDLLLSMYKQYIQEGGVLPLSGFYGDNGIIRPRDLSFRLRIELIEKKFPGSYFLNYEAYKATGDEYIRRFFAREFGVTYDDSAAAKKMVKSNSSITGSKIEWLRIVNRYYNRWPRRLRSGLRYFGWSPRDIFQNRLDFWKPKDSEKLQRLAGTINGDFEEDWDYFKSHQWCAEG